MTQQQALNWLNGGWKSSPYAKTIPAAGGLGIDVDGIDGFQCKDFANAYGIYLSAPLPIGNAIVLSQKLAVGWNWTTSPQAGDLAVRNYVNAGVNYGDVVAILAVNSSSLSTIGQNQVHSSLTIGHVPTTGINPINGFIKFIRYNYEETDMATKEQLQVLYGLAFPNQPLNNDWVAQWTGKNMSDALNTLRDDPSRQSYITRIINDAAAYEKGATPLQPGTYQVK